MKKFIIVIIFVFAFSMSVQAGIFNKEQSNVSVQTHAKSEKIILTAQQKQQESTTYPQDVDSQPIAEGEYVDVVDIEQMYRDIPVPDFKYVHNVDPGEFQDIKNSAWSPYPLFRLTAPLYYKTIAVEPGYYLLTPRQHDGKWYILFKEAGKIKYIVPVYKREMVPYGFYKNNLPKVKLTRAQEIREKTLKFVGEHFKHSMREPIPDTFLEASDYENNFISIIVYWGNYRYYMVLRTIQL